MLQRLQVPLSQVQAGKNLLNEIHQIINPLNRGKEITIKVYSKIMNSVTV